MRSIWKGSISFGLVNIPITLFPAVHREELKFRLLRASDRSPVNYKRVAEVDGKEVPWDQIVKGYEHEKDNFVVLKDDDFKRVDLEATQTVDLIHFVKLSEVNPFLFYKPYFMEVQKGADKAYVLLRDALRTSGKIGIAKVVIKTRQHLAAVKAQGDGLILELMHFNDELVDLQEFKSPARTTLGKQEMNMAKSLVDSMTAPWRPEEYTDEYREQLEKVIEDKIEHPEKGTSSTPGPRKSKKVIDLVAVLQQSLQQTKPKRSNAAATRKKATPSTRGTRQRRKAA